MDIKERFYENLAVIREQAEQLDEVKNKDSYTKYMKRIAGKARNAPEDEGNWSKKMKKQQKKAEK